MKFIYCFLRKTSFGKNFQIVFRGRVEGTSTLFQDLCSTLNMNEVHDSEVAGPRVPTDLDFDKPLILPIFKNFFY